MEHGVVFDYYYYYYFQIIKVKFGCDTGFYTTFIILTIKIIAIVNLQVLKYTTETQAFGWK